MYILYKIFEEKNKINKNGQVNMKLIEKLLIKEVYGYFMSKWFYW